MSFRASIPWLAVLASCAPNVIEGEIRGEVAIPPGTTRLRVTLEKGEISLVAGDPGRVSWAGPTRRGATFAEDLASLADVPLDLERVEGERGELWLRGPRVPEDVAARDPGAALVVKLLMRAPPDLEVVLETGRGRLGVDDRHAPVMVRTGSGDVQLREVHGAAKTFTGSGNHFVIDHHGDLESESRHGDYFVYVSELGPAGVSLVAASGNVQCNLPADAGFSLDAATGLGVIKCGYEVEVVEDGRGARAAAEVAGGGPRVSLRTERGNVNARPTPRDG